jgi:hypothetical protein
VFSSLKPKARRRAAALLGVCAFVLTATGCHNHNLNSGFGVAWVSLTADRASTFTSYVVTIDSVVLVGKTVGSVTAVGAGELIDLTKLTNISELWSTASVPVDTYTSATITLDYTSAQIYVMVNGVPTLVTAKDALGNALTTVTVVVNLDPNNQLILQPTLDTSNALRLAFNFDLAASNKIDMTTSPPTLTVAPYMTISTSASDNKLIRVRGPLINSSVNTGTYTVVVRPFFDEVNSLGTLTIFNDPSTTIYALGGTTYVGQAGLTALSQTSAGSTMTAAFTTFEPTATTAPGITAGIFHSNYVIAGSTLEDFYTDGLEGDVIARSGNTLTLRGATLFVNAAQSVQVQSQDSFVVLGPSTLVTVDGVATLGPLDYNSVSVGQHITARGLPSVSSAGVLTLDSTGSTATNTGSVRIQSSELFGSLVSSVSGSLLLNLQTVSNWPASIFDFTGTGTGAAQDATPANYLVNTGTLTLPVASAGDPLAIDGYVSPFGTAPPDFIAAAINAEPTIPATLVVTWTGTGTAAPFSSLTSSGMTIDLANAAFGSGQILIGAESIDITTLGATPQIVPEVPTGVPVSPAGAPPVFQPLFSVGPGGSATATVNPILSFNGFGSFVTQLNTTFATPTPATKFVANGLYDRASNIFTATRINVVL